MYFSLLVTSSNELKPTVVNPDENLIWQLQPKKRKLKSLKANPHLKKKPSSLSSVTKIAMLEMSSALRKALRQLRLT